jgi:hypothetical protein
LYRAVRRGSAADRRWSASELVRDVLRGGTAPDTTLTMKQAMSSPQVVDLGTARVSMGDPAPTIVSPPFDVRDGTLRETGEIFDLQSHAGRRPVALVFGSFT